jgi:hypothetical protein
MVPVTTRNTMSTVPRLAAAAWLVVSAVVSLYYLVCFAAPQLTSRDLMPIISCLMPAHLSPEEHRKRLQECEDAEIRASLQQQHQQERRRSMRGVLVWGSMLLVSAALLRRERPSAQQSLGGP